MVQETVCIGLSVCRLLQQITYLCVSDNLRICEKCFHQMFLSQKITTLKWQLRPLNSLNLNLLKSKDEFKRKTNEVTKSQEMKKKREKGLSIENDIGAITFQQDLLL